MGVRLPPEYQETEWIEGTRNIHLIDTGIPGNRNTLIIEAKVKPGNFIQYAPLWGNYRGENYNVTRLIAYASNSILSYINTKAGGGTSAVTIPPLFGTGKTFVIRQERTKLTIDGTKYTIPANSSGAENNSNIAINAATTGNQATGTYTTQRWYYFRIFDGEIVLRDFVPCYRKSDMIAGMYDLVSNAFFANARTGKTSEFTAGPDVIDSISPLMVAWRRMLMQKPPIDTSPRIAEYGKHCNRSNEGLTENESWCYTDWYDFPKPHGNITYQQLTGMDASHTFQEIDTDTGSRTWNYPKISITQYYDKVRFSIKISLLSTCYFIRDDTGEIIFAGRDSIYYGHKNISEIT